MIVKLKPEDGPVKNTAILQKYLDAGGTVRLEQPGTYELTGPLLIGSETALEFGPGVIVRRSAEGHRNGPLIVNKGTFSGEWDHRYLSEFRDHTETRSVDIDADLQDCFSFHYCFGVNLAGPKREITKLLVRSFS